MVSGKKPKLTLPERRRKDSYFPVVQIRVFSCGFVDRLFLDLQTHDPRNHTKQKDHCGDPQISEVTLRTFSEAWRTQS
jgi:hypothetical protein